MTRSLLLKGLAGVAALGGAAGGLAVYRKEIFGGWGKAPEEKSEDVSKFSQKDLIDKVGLNCGLTDGETEVTDSPKDCTVKDNGSINIKKREQEEEGVTFTGNGSTKLKVSKSEEVVGGTEKYNKKLKFVVDSGDLNLTKKEGSSTPTTIQKLEQFETYEIFLKDKKFYLRRKTDSKEEKIKALGLPSGCSLPDTGDSNCSLTTEGEIKKVNFENQTGGVTVSTGTVTLKISKMGDSDTDFGENKYRFTFTFPGDVTINSKQLKGNTPYDFKIKKGETGNTLTLEKAWSEDKEFAKKAGLDCNDNTQCSISSGSKLNVKAGTKIKEGISSINTGTGKIKMETGQAGYNQGLKFTITSGDVTISDGTASGSGGDITKLEELETYEITEEGGKFYLSLKTSKKDGIKSSLSLPKGCDLPTAETPVECSLSADDFKNINFKDKSSPSASGTVKLKISKANSTDFPLGYRFTFNTTTEATITASTNTIKANIPTDYKIKKSDSTPTTLSLEKAWSEFSFAEKVGLTCTTGSDGCCTKSGSSELNVKKGTDKKEKITSADTSSSKIKVEKDQAGYNQGLKFTITGGNVTLTGGNGSGSFNTLDEYETYEITEEGDKYYLTRKTEAIKTIETQLGLTAAGCSLSGSSSSCSLTSDKLQKINFSEKGSPTIGSSGTATLTITSGANSTDFPNGYKFTLQSTTGDITIKATDNVVKKNISTDFKIKKAEGQNPSLTLEKAWTAESLGKKVNLNCTTSSNECTINGGTLNIKQDDKSDTGISKNNSGSNGKIKVKKDQEGYNQGFKFTISDGNISLSGGSASEDNKIKHLEEYETYEIKEEGDKWYLVRKDKAQVFINKALNIGEFCTGNFPEIGDTSPETCNNIEDLNKLKTINFEGKNGHTNWGSGTIKVQLAIERDTKGGNNGLKFTFTDDDSSATSICLPTGKSNGIVNLKDSSNSAGVEYKIKKCEKNGEVTLTLEKKDNNGGSSSCK